MPVKTNATPVNTPVDLPAQAPVTPPANPPAQAPVTTPQVKGRPDDAGMIPDATNLQALRTKLQALGVPQVALTRALAAGKSRREVARLIIAEQRKFPKA